MEDQLVHLGELFSRFQTVGFTVKLSKVQFASSQLPFLGHFITSEGVRLEPSRTLSIREFPKPRNVKNLARFFEHGYFLQVCAKLSPNCNTY